MGIFQSYVSLLGRLLDCGLVIVTHATIRRLVSSHGKPFASCDQCSDECVQRWIPQNTMTHDVLSITYNDCAYNLNVYIYYNCIINWLTHWLINLINLINHLIHIFVPAPWSKHGNHMGYGHPARNEKRNKWFLAYSNIWCIYIYIYIPKSRSKDWWPPPKEYKKTGSF